jgi:hypothetical protein
MIGRFKKNGLGRVMDNQQENSTNRPRQTVADTDRTQTDQEQVKDPNTMAQQEFQPESGSLGDQEERQIRRRHSLGTERVERSPGEVTEEA